MDSDHTLEAVFAPIPPQTIQWIRAWGYPGGVRLDPGGTIARGNKVRMCSRVSDPETASSELSVNVSYRVQGGSWITESAIYRADVDYWYVDWVIPFDAATGLYDVKIDVMDSDGGVNTYTEMGEFMVGGNLDPGVEWIRAWGYPGGVRLDPGGTIARGNKVRMCSRVSDPETASSEHRVGDLSR
jgi:hypothetical protein